MRDFLFTLIVFMIIMFFGLFLFSTIYSTIENGVSEMKTNNTQINNTQINNTLENISSIDESYTTLLNLFPVIIIIMAIGLVLGIVNTFLTGSSGYSTYTKNIAEVEEEEEEEQKEESKKYNVPDEIQDYVLHKLTNVDEALETAKALRDNGYWVKVKRFNKKAHNIPDNNYCGVYRSRWRKDEEIEKPKWRDN